MSTSVERRFLARLAKAGERGIAESSVPKTCLPMLKQLEGCACVRRIQGVRGARFVVHRFDVLAKFDGATNPLGITPDAEPPSSRADAALRFGDAKAASTSDCLGVFVRSIKPGVTVTSAAGTLHVSDLTKVGGGAALLLHSELQWTCSGNFVALIENAEAFWHHEQVLPEVDLAIWTAGRMSTRRLLAWLASPGMAHCQYVHWGDYDPVGVAEYVRLRRAFDNRVAMWAPEDLEELFKRHGKKSLLLRRGNARVYARLRSFVDDPTVARLVQLFDQYAVGVEQEICLCVDKGR